MTPRFAIFVAGDPRPKGSKRAVMRPGAKHPTLIEMGTRLPQWKVALRAAMACAGITIAWRPHEPVRCRLVFSFVRPNSHTGKRGLTKSGRSMPCPTGAQVGDIDKLTRAVLDELPMLNDDRQVVAIDARKLWGKRQGVHIEIFDACAKCGGAIAPGAYHLCIVPG